MQMPCPQCRATGLLTLTNSSLKSCDQCAGTGRLVPPGEGDQGFARSIHHMLNRLEKTVADIDESLKALGAAVDGVGLRIQEQHTELTAQISALQAALADSQNPEAQDALAKLETVARAIDEQVAELNTLAAFQADLPETPTEGGQSPAEPVEGDTEQP